MTRIRLLIGALCAAAAAVAAGAARAQAEDAAPPSMLIAPNLPFAGVDGVCLTPVWRPGDESRSDVIVEIEPERVEPIARPAEIRWVEREIVLRPQEIRYETTPPVFERRIETVVVEPARLEYFVDPAELAPVEEDIVIRAAQTVWRPGPGPVERRNPQTGTREHQVTLPAQTQTVTRQELRRPARVASRLRPAVTREIEVEILVRPAEIRTIVTPAVTQTILVQEIVRPSAVEERRLPARRAAIPRRSTAGDSATDWRRALCETELPQETVRAIQRALRRAGFDAGPVDGRLGPATRAALVAFQGVEPLSERIFLLDTLEALGVRVGLASGSDVAAPQTDAH